MNKSESIKNIGAALVVFHDKVGNIKKDAQNPFFKSSYASLSNILESIQKPLKESGLIFTQFPGEGLTTILIHPASGEWIESEYKIHPVKNDPQAVGSAITYARRYALGAILGLNIEIDDDGNAASHPATNGATKTATVNGNTTGLPELKVGDPNFNKAVKALKEKKRTLADIKKAFYLPTVTETVLMREVKAEIVNN